MGSTGNQLRFDTLDGLRGVAAILVLFYHLGPSSPIPAPAGYVAVDLFFGLSGFVLAHAYEDRLRSGLTLREFLVLRWMRVYPMALIGAGIGVLLSGRYFLSLLLLPDVGEEGALFPAYVPLYPANVPLWSLGLELIVNFAFAVTALRVGPRGIGVILIGSGAVLCIGVDVLGLGALGAFWNTIGYGLARTVFSFTLGVGLRRVHAQCSIRRRRTHLAWLPPAALLLLLTTIPADRQGWELALVFLLLPALLWLGTLWEVPDPRVFAWLGGLSYPLYCIHGVIIQAYDAAEERPAWLWIALIGAACWLDHRVDRPLYRYARSRRSARGEGLGTLGPQRNPISN